MIKDDKALQNKAKDLADLVYEISVYLKNNPKSTQKITVSCDYSESYAHYLHKFIDEMSEIRKHECWKCKEVQ